MKRPGMARWRGDDARRRGPGDADERPVGVRARRERREDVRACDGSPIARVVVEATLVGDEATCRGRRNGASDDD